MSDTVKLLREAKNAHVTDSDVEQYKGIVSPMSKQKPIDHHIGCDNIQKAG